MILTFRCFSTGLTVGYIKLANEKSVKHISLVVSEMILGVLVVLLLLLSTTEKYCSVIGHLTELVD